MLNEKIEEDFNLIKTELKKQDNINNREEEREECGCGNTIDTDINEYYCEECLVAIKEGTYEDRSDYDIE